MAAPRRRDDVHVLTPGDHFSPRTGSAVPTVVDGLSRALGDPGRSRVLVARGTMTDRYGSAEVIQYDPIRWHAPGRRYLDPGLGRIGLPRFDARRTWAAGIRRQRDWPASIIIGHNGPQLMPSVDLRRHAAVLYAHNQLFQTYSRSEVARTLRGVDRIICVSDFLAERTADQVGTSLARRIVVVRNGVDIQTFHPRRAPARSDGGLHVMLVGRMIRPKGADVLVRALASLNRNDVKATILGSAGFDAKAPLTPFEQELRALAAPLGDRIRFIATAARTDVPQYLRQADVLVVPSRWPDPCPLTVGEGLATGVPVIASAVGGIPEIMGGSGIRVPPDSPEELARSIEAFADDESFRLRVGQACRLRAVANDWAWARRHLDAAVEDLR